MTDLMNLPAPPLTDEDLIAAHRAVDVADHIMRGALDFAQEVLGPVEAQPEQVLLLTQAFGSCAARVYAAQGCVAATRESTPEIAGAINEAGTDIGSGFALAVEQILKKFPDDNTNDG